MFLPLISFLSVFTYSHKATKASLCDEFPNMNCIEYKGVEGNYANANYVNAHRIYHTRFSYKATGEHKNYPLSNAFDYDDSKTYWIAASPNSGSFHNSITVEFHKTVTLEAVLYYASFNTNGNNRKFNGTPTKLKIYTSIGNQLFQLEAVFVGTPKYPMAQLQFVFDHPIRCDKIKLEFIEVTPDTFTSDGTQTPVTGGISFIQKLTDTEISFTNVQGNFADKNYFDKHKIATDLYTYSSTPSKSNHPLSYAFDSSNKGTYWVSLYPNNATFTNQITVTFSYVHNIEGFVYYPAYNTVSGKRTFQGSPTRMTVYSSVGGKDMKVEKVVYGNYLNNWEQFQVVFPNPIHCDKIMLEFNEVTPDNYDSKGALHPVIGGITFLDTFEYHTTKFTNKDLEQSYINSHRIAPSDFTRKSSESLDGHQLELAFDDSDRKSYWVAKNPNTNTFRNYITVEFNSIQAIESFLLFTAYSTNKDTKIRTFSGAPLKMNILAAVEKDEFELKAVFEGTPGNDWEYFQYVFEGIIVCKQLKLEFVDVTPEIIFIKDNKPHPTVGGITFLKNTVPAATERPPATPRPPDATPSRTPFPPAYSCGDDNNRCEIKGDGNKQTQVTVSLTNFNKLDSNNDGGAIHLINTALNCENVKFNDCKATSGGGGGIYVQNNVDEKSELKLENLEFKSCKAMYGGAVYLYSSSENVPAIVTNCKFTANEATRTTERDDNLFGGAALFLYVKAGKLKDNTFTRNVGRGAMKIINKFPRSLSKILRQDMKRRSVVISNCRLENDKSGKDCLIFYVGGNNGVTYDVRDCVFVGSLKKGAHFVDGLSLDEKSTKIHIKGCKFASDSERSINFGTNFVTIDMRTQTFNFKETTRKEEERNIFTFFTLSEAILCVSCLVVVLLLSIFVLYRRKTQEQTQTNEEGENSTKNNDPSNNHILV